MSRWTYEGYWNAVLGANRNAEDVIREFELNSSDKAGMDEWLGNAEIEAAIQLHIRGTNVDGLHAGEFPREWREYHTRALEELCKV